VSRKMNLLHSDNNSRCRVAAYTVYPPSNSCSNNACKNFMKLLKKEKAWQAIIYTFAHGAQPAWAVILYCAGTILQTNPFIDTS
jgi:hypothetical protein